MFCRSLLRASRNRNMAITSWPAKKRITRQICFQQTGPSHASVVLQPLVYRLIGTFEQLAYRLVPHLSERGSLCAEFVFRDPLLNPFLRLLMALLLRLRLRSLLDLGMQGVCLQGPRVIRHLLRLDLLFISFQEGLRLLVAHGNFTV